MRRVLSYSNVVSSLALVVAVSGGAYAAVVLPKNSVGAPQIKAQAVRSGEVKDRSLLPRDSRNGAVAAFAFIREVGDGSGAASIGYGRGVASVEDNSAAYRVTFASNVANCAVVAVPGSGKPKGDPAVTWGVSIMVTVDMDEALGPKTVDVYFRHATIGIVDTSFTITAIC
ncbi:MAG TPA: hypothetical protein VFK41_00330 [Nocardioidaceae bacterium]|nr:hypothetical protein [Nocardioidaceae bacterium]